MDYSQIIAAQKLSEDARKRQELTEDEFYQSYGVTFFERVQGWKARFFQGRRRAKESEIDNNCRPAVQKLC